MKIRLAIQEDLRAVVAVQQKCPEAAAWRLADYEVLVRDPGGNILVAELPSPDSPGIAGFAAFHRIIDEVEIRNMAVDPEHRRQGVGRALLFAGRARMMAAGVRRVYLEVRQSNMPARALYSSLGFVIHSTRKNYYQDPSEDALVLALDLRPTSEVQELG